MVVASEVEDDGILDCGRRSILNVHGRFAEWKASEQYRGCDCAT
jgi:hypothetical protein